MISSALARSIRSELVRLRRLWKLPAAAAALAAVATALAFSGSSSAGPGSRSATADSTSAVATASLETAEGIVRGIAVAGTIVTALALVMWALSVARDMQTGSIRILLVTEARRVTYLGGKLVALTAATLAMTAASVATSVATAYAIAPSRDVSTADWAWSEVGSTLVNLALTAALWGAAGALVAVLARSSATAIAGGLSYFLLGERLVSLVWSDAPTWLPSGTASNLLAGGTATTSYTHSLALTIGYLAVAAAITLASLVRRDITD